MRTLQVHFISGREVLGHYWGLLSGGGLALPMGSLEEDLPVPGERVHLTVHISSIKKTYELEVQALEVRPSSGPGPGHGPGGQGDRRLMVAFLSGSKPDELLDAAWADGCDSPQRRTRRVSLAPQAQVKVRYERLDGGPMEGRTGRLVNLSQGGCCVEGSALPPPGTQVLLTTVEHEVKLVGRVRWTERPECGLMGIEFLGPAPDVGQLMQCLAPECK